MPIDVVALAQSLLRCASVTPADDGALNVVAAALESLGFTITWLPFGPEGAQTPNLFARLGTSGPHLCFAGHTDVVPPGNGWRHEPFAGQIDDDTLYGRGASDMKGGIAAFIAAVSSFLARRPLNGSISLLITGDEEGPSRHGTCDVLPWMQEHGQVPDFCLVGEPTNPMRMGDVIKVGRRGSLNAHITVQGVQGHVAYPHLADNPIHYLLPALTELTTRVLDEGNAHFAPSSLQITSIDVGNPATNVIPPKAQASLNIRFNDSHRGEALKDWIEKTVAKHASNAHVETAISGEAFLTEPGEIVEKLAHVVKRVTGRTPRLDTGGGTSDARFISAYCPVAEFGLVGASMHKADEHVALCDLRQLTEIYLEFLEAFGL
ncbi:succinyl-diaminopimelate desuccinylase [Kozakia baliensis]|uniref:Succinyl-diaminopimelate desuccinylase n=1 Tax=Kozakia baliensis TaxID=153496 RepID=A0A1D8URP4_9PROT|nr:succinyl-diaminopimelate desuccinylase [Kozakia baliensis]AOX16332.1 succinyl-diaminopimelate desuccinylase [Kozakia baliensis]GBR28645.1 succinyl-diaminopimelate desuccinylase [Kozakia baliensis NRIC 0488]